MANIIGLSGFSKSDGTEKLIAVFGNDFHIWNSTLDRWDGQSISVTSSVNKWRSSVFLDKAFFVNGWRITSAGTIAVNDDTKRYDGTTWTNEYTNKRLPIALYVRQVKDRLYMANLYFKTLTQTFPSKVWYCDLPENNDIKWGFEEGLNLTGTKGTKLVTVPFAQNYFKVRNIKIGDPLTLTSTSLSKNLYHVDTVTSDFALTLTENLEDALTNEDFWTGSNWFDVATNDNDVITGLGENNDRLLVFKRDSLYRFSPPPSATLTKIKGVPGTTSQESVVNIKQYTYYFHRTGIWRTDGTTAELISRPLQEYIDAISPDIYPNVIGWRTGSSLETYRLYVGDVTDIDSDIDVDKCFIDFDTITEKLSIGNLPYGVTSATEFSESNTRNIYLGTDINRVYQDNKGNDDGGTAIPFMMDTGFHFPVGPTIQVAFDKVQIHTKDGRGMQIRYKLYGTPWTKDKQWRGSLDDLDNEVTEIKMGGRPEISNIGRGIAFEITSSAINRSPTIERIDVHWKPTTQRSL